MAAYLLADIEVIDATAYVDYARNTPTVVALHGGRYLARGGAVQLLEGVRRPHHVALLEFVDMAQLMAFYRSPKYQALASIRMGASRATIIAMDGI